MNPSNTALLRPLSSPRLELLHTKSQYTLIEPVSYRTLKELLHGTLPRSCSPTWVETCKLTENCAHGVVSLVNVGYHKLLSTALMAIGRYKSRLIVLLVFIISSGLYLAMTGSSRWSGQYKLRNENQLQGMEAQILPQEGGIL